MSQAYVGVFEGLLLGYSPSSSLSHITSENVSGSVQVFLILYISCIKCKLNVLFQKWNVPNNFIWQHVFCLVGMKLKYHEKYVLQMGLVGDALHHLRITTSMFFFILFSKLGQTFV